MQRKGDISAANLFDSNKTKAQIKTSAYGAWDALTVESFLQWKGLPFFYLRKTLVCNFADHFG